MYELLIGNYIQNLKADDIKRYSQEKGISISDKDAKILLITAKKDWKVFYRGDPTNIIASLKNQLEPKTYAFGLALWDEYKKKIPR